MRRRVAIACAAFLLMATGVAMIFQQVRPGVLWEEAVKHHWKNPREIIDDARLRSRLMSKGWGEVSVDRPWKDEPSTLTIVRRGRKTFMVRAHSHGDVMVALYVSFRPGSSSNVGDYTFDGDKPVLSGWPDDRYRPSDEDATTALRLRNDFLGR